MNCHAHCPTIRRLDDINLVMCNWAADDNYSDSALKGPWIPPVIKEGSSKESFKRPRNHLRVFVVKAMYEMPGIFDMK